LRRLFLAVMVAATAAAAASGCTNFQDPSTVVDLRVLAVRVEPSEVILDVDLSDPTMPILRPASNPALTVEPLIVDPAGNGRPVTYTITACPNDPFAAGPPGAQTGGAFPSGGARTTVGSELCDDYAGPTWAIAPTPVAAGSSTVIQPTAAELETAFMADVFPDQNGNLHGGFDLGMPLSLQITVDAGTEQIKVLKRVLYWARRIDAAQMPNQTPVTPGIDSYPNRDSQTGDPIGPIDTVADGAPFPISAGATRWFQPETATAEPYETTVIDPTTDQAVPFSVARETIRYAFYASAGTFTPFRTFSELPPGFTQVGDHVHIESQYSPPGKLDALPIDPVTGARLVTLWFTVADDRGGESWVIRTLAISP
jgi:hypothetical protein